MAYHAPRQILFNSFFQPVCNDCGGTVIEYDTAAGNGFCVKCGTVVEENTIVNEVAFGETSNGAAMVQGSFVGQGASMLFIYSFHFPSD
jgi:transcription factor IIIB subunit 2